MNGSTISFAMHILGLIAGLLASPIATAQSRVDAEADQLNKLMSRGFAALESGQFEDAQKSFQQFIKIVPYEPSSRILLARCQSQLGNQDQAIASIAKASELGWEDATAVRSYQEFNAMSKLPGFNKAVAMMEHNQKQPFVLYVGSTVNRSQAAPLVVLYHGRGELPHIQLHYWKNVADRIGCYILALKGTRSLGSVYAWERLDAKKTWQVDTAGILAETNRQLKKVTGSNKISKLVLAGFSQGGVAAMEMLHSELILQPSGGIFFATAFPSQPKIVDKMFAQDIEFPSRPICIHVGREDQWLNGNQAVVDRLKKQGLPVNIHVWKNTGHQMPPNHERVILESMNDVLNGE